MAAVTLPFGGNRISKDEKGIYTITFVNGGKWTFDQKEIDNLNKILTEFQTNCGAIERELRRTKGGTVIVANILGYLHLKESAQSARFWGQETYELQDAIRRLK
jgi:hypothetical protein